MVVGMKGRMLQKHCALRSRVTRTDFVHGQRIASGLRECRCGGSVW